MLDSALNQTPPETITVAPDANRASQGSVLTITQYRKMFTAYRDGSQDNRLLIQEDRRYYDGDQLTREEKAELHGRGQPDIVINRTRVAVNGVLGVAARSRTDPRAYPRTPGDEDGADVATDSLRYITEKNRFKPNKIKSFKNFLVEGTCAVLIGIRADRNIDIKRIRPEEFFYDIHAREEDFSDARYMGIAKWMWADDLAEAFPAAGGAIEQAVTSNGLAGIIDETFEDRPKQFSGWIDTVQRRVLVIEMYHRTRKQWYKTVFYGGGVLEEIVSPYLDQEGKPCNPIEAQSAYIDGENRRYGMVRDMKPLQDEINKRRSKLLHLLSVTQIQAEDPSAIEVDADTARVEAARPDGVIPYGWRKVPTSSMAQGEMQLLGEAKSEMERFGPNPAVLGRQGSDSSGRALLTRQQAGLVELAVLFDGFEDWELRVYRQAWARAKQFWTGPMWIRITDDLEAPKFVQINAPVTRQQTMDSNEEPVEMSGPASMGLTPAPNMSDAPLPMDRPNPLLAGAMGMQGPGQPNAPVSPSLDLPDGVLGYKNKIAEIDIDIIIDTQPETATIMAEQLKDLIDLVSKNPTYAQEVPFEILVDMTPLPRKRQLIKRIREFREAAGKARAAAAAAQAELEHNQAQAAIKKDEATAELTLAKIEEVLARAAAIPEQTEATVVTAIAAAERAGETPAANDGGEARAA